MRLRNLMYLALFVTALYGGFSDGATSEQLAAVCVLGLAYAMGGTHGIYLAWSQERRMRRWADRVVTANEAPESAESEAA